MDGGLTIVHRKNEGGIYLVDEKVIKVVDDIMGSGKSTWAINYINNNQEKKFCVSYLYWKSVRGLRNRLKLI